MCIVNLWNSLTEEVTESNTMVEFKKQLGNFMTTNSFGSSAQQAEIMIRVIKSLVSGCKLPTGGCPIQCLPFVLWTFLVNTHLQGGSAMGTGDVIQHFYASVSRFTFIGRTCNIGPEKTGLEIVCSTMTVKTINGLYFLQVP